MKKTVCFLLVILMLAALGCTAFAQSLGVEPGQAMPDFTVSLTDGSSATLSELLKEKDLVVLNVFATWCGPCEREFPEMEKTYQAHSDRMVILSVSGDPDDTMEMIGDYKSSHNLSFPMGQAGSALDFLTVPGFPTTFFIAGDGKVGFIKVGAFLSGEEFEEKVGTFLSNDYDGIPLPSEIAKSSSTFLVYLLLAIIVVTAVLVAARWLLFRKAGKPGWHSLIPFLSAYREFSLCWNGWFGILSVLFTIGIAAVPLAFGRVNWTAVCSSAFTAAVFVMRLVESLKLAKAFGKGAGTGILLLIFGSFGRLVLGISKAKYRNI